MKKTPLYQKHIDLGAKMAPFAGFMMPVQYSGIQDEHHAVRNHVGVFDVSHMGEFIIRGKKALDLVQYVTGNDASVLEIGDVQYSYFPNRRGGIVDDLLVYRLTEEHCSKGEKAYMLVVNASNMKKDWAWVNQHNRFGCEVINISSKTGLIAVQGPKATQVLDSLTDMPLSQIAYYHFRKGVFAGFDNVLVSATGYTGAGGFEIYADQQHIAGIWDAVMEAGQKYKILPAGLGARDSLRLEKAFPLYGHDLNQYTSPIEARLSWATKLEAGDFVGRDVITRKKEKGVTKRLVGFRVTGKRVPRHGYSIVSTEEKPLGVVTSGTFSPTLAYPIGMGYVQKGYTKVGTPILIRAGRKYLEATIVKLPFVK